MSFLSKIEEMVREEMHTEMSVIDCNIEDDVFLMVAKKAHEKDITFNQMVTVILEEQIANMVEEEDNDESTSTS